VTDGEFSIPIRVYIEDTDAGGIVYYVNYLKFMERSRTEYMRAQGFDKHFVFNNDLMFVVTDVSVKYLKPAVLDDELLAAVRISQLSGATMTMLQSICRGEDILAQGEVKIACVGKSGLKPRRIPKEMVARLCATQ
jgi:tol-pal system-associated acyl-CoA thioesterase